MKTKLVALLLVACLLAIIGCSKSSTEPKNEPPIIIGLIAEPDTIGTSQKVILTCFAYDPDDDSLSYTWEVIFGSINGTGPIVEWTPPDTNGTFSIICIVDDGNEGQDTDNVSIHVIKETQNEPPVIIGLIAEPDTIGTSQKATLECFASDPDGDSLSYTWEVIFGSINGTGPIVEWTPPDTTGTFSIICIVDDGNEGQDTDNVSVHVIKMLFRVTKILEYNMIDELQVYRDSFKYNAKNKKIRNEIFNANDEFIGLELYEYDEEDFLIRRSNFIPSDSIHILNWYRTNYQYDENEPTRCDIFDNNDEQIGYLIWEYNNNNEWEKLIENDVSDSLMNYWGNFEYDESGVFSKWYWFDSNNNLIRYREWEFEEIQIYK
ncbi:MAG: hypothetical protein KAW92_03965 [Candidatus Cloacimonetes bacterium]|nr:hypothetical protein [Candidatus Cloacimonadota bacterium]